jgi:hypothetical protein
MNAAQDQQRLPSYDSTLTNYAEGLEALRRASTIDAILQGWPNAAIPADLCCWRGALTSLRHRLQNQTVNGSKDNELSHEARHTGAFY